MDFWLTEWSLKGVQLNHILGVIRRPIARLRLISLRPALVLIRARKPNMRTRLILLTRLG